MLIPSYKKIHITSATKENVQKQMGNIKFAETPVILIINLLKDQEGDALNLIEEFSIDNKLQDYPYPVYVISSFKNYGGILNVFSTVENCPDFYNQKITPLNVKEVNLLNSIKLKQANLSNILQEEITPVVSEYAMTHKKIAKIHKEMIYLIELNTKLGMINDGQ